MTLSIHDYLLPQDGIDWSAVLRSWHWLLPREFTLWMVNRFAECIIVVADGSVHSLHVGEGELERLADSRDDFAERIDWENNANDWLMMPLVDELVAAGMTLGPGQCYGFKLPPIVGGSYGRENIAVKSIEDYLGGFGSIHKQLKDLPDGTEVVFKIINQDNDSES